MSLGRRCLQTVPILLGGIFVGVTLAVITHGYAEANSAAVAVVTLLLFVLAAMTGVAKTTTA